MELRAEIKTRMSEYLCFTPDGPGVWVGLRKYFGTTEIIHEHDFFELVLVRAGTGIHLTETGEYQVGPGSVFLVTPGCAHGYRQMSEFEIINILYLPKRLKMELADLAKDAVCQAILGKTADSVLHDGFMLDADHMAMAGAILRELESEQQLIRHGRRFAMHNGFQRLMLLLSRAVAESAGIRDELTRFNRILRYIAERDGEMLRPAEIASACNLSLRTLERVFIRHLGCSPGAYLIDRRLNRGAGLLASTDRTITEIAYSCGFRESNYFCKLFRRKFFLSPQEYRRKFLPLQNSPRRGVDER